MEDFKKIVEKINEMAKKYKIGELQKIRAELHGKRIPSNKLFDSRTTSLDKGDEYAFHFGGRNELQFNIGSDIEDCFRYGVAFSFQPSPSLKDPTSLLPKVALFNEYIGNKPKELSNLMMWRYDSDEHRSKNYDPSPIPQNLIDEEYFVFLGSWQKKDQIDYTEALETLDSLLPLYLYIEKNAPSKH